MVSEEFIEKFRPTIARITDEGLSEPIKLYPHVLRAAADMLMDEFIILVYIDIDMRGEVVGTGGGGGEISIMVESQTGEYFHVEFKDSQDEWDIFSSNLTKRTLAITLHKRDQNALQEHSL